MTKAAAGMVPPNVRIFNLSFLFFASGMVMYLIAMIIGIFEFPELIQAQGVRNTTGWMLAHLFLLGWATMIAMGASFQLTQVILRTSLFSRSLGFIHFALYLVGVLTLTISFSLSFPLGAAIGGGFVFVAVLIYVFNLLVTFVKKREWNMFVFGVTMSLFNLVMTVIFGLMMGIGMAFQWIPFDYSTVFNSHIWLGIVGWLASLIMTYSFKLLPMFYASPVKGRKEGFLILGLLHAGVWSYTAFLWSHVQMLKLLSYVLLLISLSLFVRFVWNIRNNSYSKQPPGPVSIPYLLIPLVYFLTIVWMLISLAMPETIFPIETSLVIFVILGWFSASILGYLFKIVPFLWWSYRFHTKWEKKSKVLLADMVPADKTTDMLHGYLLGIIMVCAAFLFSEPLLGLAGQILAVLFTAAYMIEILKVFRY
ncbi:MAG: hypothetical protein H0Z32_11810 [Bacillaceae bacterium]|nr:hypothetical protein [Bacillaceae bacterium]